MKPVAFPQQTTTRANDQPNYTPFPIYWHKEERGCISCFEFTPEELAHASNQVLTAYWEVSESWAALYPSDSTLLYMALLCTSSCNNISENLLQIPTYGDESERKWQSEEFLRIINDVKAEELSVA